MKKVIVLALSVSIANRFALIAINQSNLSAKADVASYLVKHHVSHKNIRGVLSNMTPIQHNMYDDTF